MNKNAIQKYAIWARNELIEQVKQRAYQYGISEKGYGDENATVIAGRVLSADEKRQRQAFVGEIKKLNFKQAVEEVAYTWFNRFVALRYMEVNDYLPTHVRVFSDASGNFNPEILTNVLHLDLPGLDKAKVSELLNANATEELYRYLLLTQCNAMNVLLPEMFERMGAYTEMLLPNNILKPESVIGRLVKDIPEEDFRDAVQIIGWLYQYYNTEPKQAVFDGLKKNIKITKENIPAATQLFTPDWIVRYMVENSLGRIFVGSRDWGLGNSVSEAERIAKEKEIADRFGWKYYIPEAEQTPEVRVKLIPNPYSLIPVEDLKILDPCMGSGHILVYAFDVLMQIYTSEGYSERDAAKLILEKNLYGLEIDRRAYQLAYFALMMKARQYNRRILTLGVRPQVYEPTGYGDGMEYGSLVRVNKLEPMPEPPKDQITLFDESYDTKLNTWNFRRLLAQKYDVVVTNPPYMGGSGMGAKMSDYVKNNYPDSKSDLFSVFIEKCGELLKPTGYQAMITMQSWMALPTFNVLRSRIIAEKRIINLLQLGSRAFDEISGEVVSTATFVLQNSYLHEYYGTYVSLTDGNNEKEKEDVFLTGLSRHIVPQDLFKKIPNEPVVFTASLSALSHFESKPSFNNYAVAKPGMQTSDNPRFLRNWFEVFNQTIGFSCARASSISSKKKWFPYNKGVGFRKWYGNNDLVVNYYNDGEELKYWLVHNPNDPSTRHWSRNMRNYDYYFREGITFTAIGNQFSARINGAGYLFDTKGPMIFGVHLDYLCGFINSVVFDYYNRILCTQITKTFDSVNLVPTIMDDLYKTAVETFVKENTMLSRADWDSFESSWDFNRHPLISGERTVAAAYERWEREAEERFDTLKANEEELNRIFIDIYGLQDELTPEVEDKDVTVRRADLGREIRSLISYAVGCMFGRYSPYKDGLIYAGGEWNMESFRDLLPNPYSLLPDPDNIIPICDDEYFDDDIVGKFVEWVKAVYGADTLQENLRFIAYALTLKSGAKATDDYSLIPNPYSLIRNYFLNDFYKDHCKIYKKRPIYWLFDSGKKNGFKALIYMHRYSRDLLAKLRTDYVHEQQERYRTQLAHIASALNTATGAQRARLLKQQDKLSEQAREISAFEEKIHHLADQNIMIDLDDGVKKNYKIFTDVLAKI